MKDAEFDRFAARYRDLHAVNIAVSGEAPEYFSDYKMRDFASIVANFGAPREGRYLDFGCGVGNAVEPFKRYFPAARLLAADVSGESLTVLASVHGDSVETVAIEDSALPLSSASLDGAFACCVFHHIPHDEHQRCLTDLRRVLRPGAPLMVYEHNPLNPLTVRAVRNCPLDENAVLIGASDLRTRIRAAGFTGVQIHYRVFFPAVLKALRPLEDKLRAVPLGAQYFAVASA